MPSSWAAIPCPKPSSLTVDASAGLSDTEPLARGSASFIAIARAVVGRPEPVMPPISSRPLRTWSGSPATPRSCVSICQAPRVSPPASAPIVAHHCRISRGAGPLGSSPPVRCTTSPPFDPRLESTGPRGQLGRATTMSSHCSTSESTTSRRALYHLSTSRVAHRQRRPATPASVGAAFMASPTCHLRGAARCRSWGGGRGATTTVRRPASRGHTCAA